MSSEKETGNEKNTKGNSLENFISSYQYSALQQNFWKVLESMKENSNLNKFRVEFEKLLGAFQSCYFESQLKTSKIRELTAANRLEEQKEIESASSLHGETVTDLKNVISNLQNSLDVVKEQRKELLDEMEELKKPLESEHKSIQVGKRQAQAICDRCKDENKSLPRTDRVNRHVSKNQLIKKEKNNVSETSILKTNLEILVADLKLTRNQILDLKKEIQKKDNLVKEYRKDLSESETRLTQVQKKILEIQKPMEISMKTYKRELEVKKKKFQKVCKDLQQAIALNTKLSKEIESKESTISNLEIKLKEAECEKKSAVRKATVFEENLAASQVNNEALERVSKSLREEIEILKKEVVTLQEAAPATKVELKVDQSSEKREGIYKWQIISRDKRLMDIGEELKATSEMVQSIKADINLLNKENTCLESEIQRLNGILKERNCEIKKLKNRLIDSMREVSDLMKKNQLQQIKHQKTMEKKNKFHSVYNETKMVVVQQKSDITILIKRQEYLVKILKQKDKEIEKLLSLTGKRYIS